MDIISKVRRFIHRHQLLDDNARIIAGISGGADSMALLDILLRLGYPCIAAHCNFHLRGSESDRDYLFVKEYCTTNNIEFVCTDFDTFGYMKEHSVSLEMAARELRYKWFEEIRTKYNADKIAVAHHLDDSVETVLINLIRGTGIKGLTGISSSNGNIVRPLLCLYRSEIIDYLTENKIKFVTDSTNNETEYTRNKIRLEVIPLLETINPSVTEAIRKTAENLSSAEKIYIRAIKQSKRNVFHQNKIDIGALLKEEEPQAVLFEILYPYGFNPETIQDIYDSVDSLSGKIFYSEDFMLLKDRRAFILEKKGPKDHAVYYINEGVPHTDCPVKLSIEMYSADTSLSIEKDRNTIYVDNSKLNYPLSIRRWQHGDKFVPFGMKGSKKLSDYFSDRKFSLIDKENTWLLCSGDTIVWIIGERADERFRITGNTKDILKITYNHRKS